MHGHPRTERGDLLGKVVPSLLAEPAAPVLKHLAHRGVKRFDLRLVEMAGLLHRRQTGAMEDLVGIGVADAAEQTRVGGPDPLITSSSPSISPRVRRLAR